MSNDQSSTVSDVDDFYLSKAPIIEAIVNFECQVPSGIADIQSLEMLAKEAFQDRYPILRTVAVAEHSLEVKNGTSVTASSKPVLKGFQLFGLDQKEVVEVRFDGFGFHRLAPYDRLDVYLPEIKRCWEIYKKMVNPQAVRKIILRYINRIQLPHDDKPLELNQYLQHGPQLPEGQDFFLTGFFHQNEFNAGKLKGKVITAIDSNQPAGMLPIIVDNSVFSNEVQTTEWETCAATIKDLRRLKNLLFKHTLTEDCRNLFR